MEDYLCKVGELYVLDESGNEVTLTKSACCAKRLDKDRAEHFEKLLNGKIIEIKKCSICGDEFIPGCRSDEIYCRDCAKTAFEILKKQDIYYTAYRKTYKTIHARAKRHGTISKIEEWRSRAQQEMNRRISAKDFLGFDLWLKNSVKDF